MPQFCQKRILLMDKACEGRLNGRLSQIGESSAARALLYKPRALCDQPSVRPMAMPRLLDGWRMTRHAKVWDSHR